jgi:hypothetical protein
LASLNIPDWKSGKDYCRKENKELRIKSIMSASIQNLRDSLGKAANNAKDWFEERSKIFTKDGFETRGGIDDSGEGAVYVYYLKGKAIYVGQTGRGVKERTRYVTSRHNKKSWWDGWSEMRLIQMPDETERLILEFNLILAYQPKMNVKPKAKAIDDLFRE